MAILCEQYGVLFLAVPRTASTALIEHVFAGRLGGRQIPAEDICASDGRVLCPAKHSTLRELIEHGVIAPNQAARLRIVAGVRNPLDSLVSLYEKQRGRYQELLDSRDTSWVSRIPDSDRLAKIASQGGFTQWLLRTWRPRQVLTALLRKKPDALLHQRFLSDATDVLRFEQLQSDLGMLLNSLDLPAAWANVPRLNPTRERRVEEFAAYYNALSHRLVVNAYHGSFVRFGYSTSRERYRGTT